MWIDCTLLLISRALTALEIFDAVFIWLPFAEVVTNAEEEHGYETTDHIKYNIHRLLHLTLVNLMKYHIIINRILLWKKVHLPIPSIIQQGHIVAHKETPKYDLIIILRIVNLRPICRHYKTTLKLEGVINQERLLLHLQLLIAKPKAQHIIIHLISKTFTNTIIRKHAPVQLIRRTIFIGYILKLRIRRIELNEVLKLPILIKVFQHVQINVLWKLYGIDGWIKLCENRLIVNHVII